MNFSKLFRILILECIPPKTTLKSLWLSWHTMNLSWYSAVTLCWFPILSCHLKPLIGKLEDTYKQSIVTTRKVLNLLVFPEDMSKAEKATTEAQKRYVKTCTTEKFVMLLRFCTGSDIIIRKKITIRITPPMSDFSLCPVAQIRGCVLELSRSYDNFLLLREHLENVLDT